MSQSPVLPLVKRQPAQRRAHKMKVENAIICDDVRKEDNGKHLIIGVYPNNMLVPKFPATLAPSLWIQLYLDEENETAIEFRIVQDDGKVLGCGSGVLPVSLAQPATTILPPSLIEIQKKCVLSFQIREKGKRWKTLKKVPVEKQPTKN